MKDEKCIIIIDDYYFDVTIYLDNIRRCQYIKKISYERRHTYFD